MDSNQIIIVLFGLLYLAYIVYTRRKSDFNEFSVAGRSLGVFLIFASLSASYIGPAMTLGLSREGFNNGFFLAFIAIFSGIALILVALFVAPRIRAKFTDSYSIGDVIGGAKSHDHKWVRIATGFVSFWLMSSICIAMSYAGGEIVNNVFGFSKRPSIAIITILVIFYSYFGGIRATIQTDAFQFVHFAILIPLLAFLLILNNDFSFADLHLQAATDASVAFDAQTAVGILGMILFWFLSSGFDSMIVNRFLAAKNESVVRRATIFAGVFLILWVLVILFIGSAAKYMHPELPDSDQMLLNLAEMHFPSVLYGIFIVAMIGIVMSSQDSSLNSASVSFSEDILGGLYPNISDQKKLQYAKFCTVIIGLLSILIAGYIESILHTIVIIFSFYAPVIIPVMLYAVFLKKHHWQAAIVSMIVGLVSFILWGIAGLDVYVPTILLGLILSTISYWGVHYWLENKEK